MWNTDIDANRLNPTYIDSYLDVSGGSVTVRGNLTIGTGTTRLSTRVYNEPYTFDADISLNNDMVVNGDVSMSESGTLNVTGDISINGFLSVGSYVNGSISINALSGDGGGGGGNGFSTQNGVTTITDDIVYTDPLQLNGDISTNVTIDYQFEYPENVFKPTDKIDTFTLVGGGSVSGSQTWSAIDVSTTGQYIIAAVTEGNIWISADYGATWRELSGASGDYAQVTGATQSWSFVAISGDGSIMMAKHIISGTDVPNLYRSVDYGKTWSTIAYNGITYTELVDQNIGYPISFVMSSDGNYIYSFSGYLRGSYNFGTNNPKFIFIYSHDGGANWVEDLKTLSPIISVYTSKSGQYVYISVYNINVTANSQRFNRYSNDYGLTFNVIESTLNLSQSSSQIFTEKMYLLDNGELYVASFATNDFRRYDLSNSTITVGYDTSYNLSNASHTVLSYLLDGRPRALYATNDGKDIAYVTAQSNGQPRYNLGRYSSNYGVSFRFIYQDPRISYYNYSVNNVPPQIGPTNFRLFGRDNDISVIYEFDTYIYISKIRSIVENSNSTVYFEQNTTLNLNNNVNAIQFADGSSITSSNIDSGAFKDNNVVFGDSSFNNMTVTGAFASAQLTDTSDYRIKTDVQTLNETHVLDNLRPVKYYQTQLAQNQIGFIAHELQEYFPELVDGEKDGDQMQSINYNGLLAILIHEIQRLKMRIANRRARILVK